MYGHENGQGLGSAVGRGIQCKCSDKYRVALGNFIVCMEEFKVLESSILDASLVTEIHRCSAQGEFPHDGALDLRELAILST